jgi:hypothetical protein
VEIAVVNSNHNGHKKEAGGERHDYLAANCSGKKWKFAKQCYLLCTFTKTGILIGNYNRPLGKLNCTASAFPIPFLAELRG